MCDKQTRPASDFYFAIHHGFTNCFTDSEGEDKDSCLIVIFKKTWDEEGYYDDYWANMATKLVQDLDFIESMECIYEFECSEEEVMKKMLAAGFIHNQEIVKHPYF